MKFKKISALVLICFLLTACVNNETSDKIDLSKAERIYTDTSIPAEDIIVAFGEKNTAAQLRYNAERISII